MKEEVRLATDKMKEKLGEDAVLVVTPDEVVEAVTSGDVPVLFLTMDSGNHEEARLAARAANDAVAASPDLLLLFGINDVADDAREIDQIPEAAATLRWFFMHLRRATFLRFTPEHQAMMLVVAGLGMRRGTELYVPDFLMKVEGELI